MPGHPKVQEFFRGPLESFTYKYPQITGIGHARMWARKHRNDPGTSFNYTTGGERRTAFVLIRKKPSERATEHDKLAEVACLPPAEQSAAAVQGGWQMSKEALSSR